MRAHRVTPCFMIELMFIVMMITTVSSRGGRRRNTGLKCEQFFDPQARAFSVGNGATEDRGVVERGYGMPSGAMLGNHVFMYAGAFGIARANGMALRHRPFPVDKVNIFEVFQIPPAFTTSSSLAGQKLQNVVLSEPAPLAFDPQCLSLRDGGATNGGGIVYNIQGYRQSYKYFNSGSTAAALRHTLRFRNETLVQYAKSWLGSVNTSATGDDRLSTLRLGKAVNNAAVQAASYDKGAGSRKSSLAAAAASLRRQVVGVHVRSGMARGGAFGGCLPPEDYYLRAMNYYRRRYSNVVFVYAAEPSGMAWFRDAVLSKDSFKGYDAFPIATTDPVETLAVLSHCDASVFSFGTYGWIGAWLADGPVTYSRHLLNENGGLKHCDIVTASGVGVKDHIPLEWIPV